MNHETDDNDQVEQSANDDGEQSKELLASAAIRYWFATGIRMGADNVDANARIVFNANGVIVRSQSNGVTMATGPQQQNIMLWIKLTGDGPRSLLMLNVVDTNDTNARTLRDTIRSELGPRIGL